MTHDGMLGFAYAIAALFSFSLSPLLYKVGLRNKLHVLEANTLRAWGALILLTPILFFQDLLSVPFSAEVVVFLVLTAILGPVIGDTLFMYAIRGIGVSISTPLANTYSLVVAAISVALFGEKLTSINILGGALILSSIWLIYLERKSIGKGRNVALGLLAGTATAILWGLSIVTMNVLLINNINPIAIIYFRTVIVALTLTVITKALKMNFKEKVDAKALVTLSIGGFFGIGLGIIMLLNAIILLGAGRASLIASASPVVASIFAMVLLKEKFRARAIIAAILVTVGAILLK